MIGDVDVDVDVAVVVDTVGVAVVEGEGDAWIVDVALKDVDEVVFEAVVVRVVDVMDGVVEGVEVTLPLEFDVTVDNVDGVVECLVDRGVEVDVSLRSLWVCDNEDP